MESVFQNCVSEFDLNLFEQSTTGNQANPATQCPVSRKMGIARMKNKLKGFNQVINKAQKGNLCLLEMQKELLTTKQELEETRNLLFEKNEEYKVICDERSTYFNQASEYSSENQTLKEQLKKFEDMSFGAHLKDKIIDGYSEQMKGLQTEMENMVEDYKLQLKTTSVALKQSKTYSTQLKKQLVRLLDKYVIPNTKERDKWLTSVIKKYISEGTQEDENEKIEKPENIVEKQDETSLDGMELTARELDCIESVDTGRGSSLGFSDGDKSFHSPNYYMNDSPHCSVCNKCNVSKKDVSTSPIPCETSDEISIVVCKKCDPLLKKDACTSPRSPQMLDNFTDTADIAFEITSRNIVCDRNLEHDLINDITNTSEVTNPIIETDDCKDASSEHTILKTGTSDTPIKLLQDFTYDSDDADDVNSDHEICSPMDELNALSSTDFNEVVNKNMQVKDQLEAASDSDDDEVMQTVSREAMTTKKSRLFSSIGSNEGDALSSTDFSEVMTKNMQVKVQLEAASDSHDDEVIQTVSEEAIVTTQSHLFSPIGSNEGDALSSTNFSEVMTKSMQVKVQLEAASDSDDDEVMQTVSREAVTTKKSRLFSPIGSNEGDALSSTDFSEVMTKNMQVKVQLEAASDSHDDEVIQTVSGEAITTKKSRLFSSIGSNEGNALSSTDFSEVMTKNMQGKVQLEAASDSHDDEVIQTVSEEAIVTTQSHLFSPIGSNEGDALSSTNFSEVMTKSMQVKVQLEAASDSDDDEVMQTVSREAITTKKSRLFSPIGSNEGDALSSTDFSEVMTKNMQVKVQLEAASDSHDDEVIQTVSEEAIVTTQSHLFSPIGSNDGDALSSTNFSEVMTKSMQVKVQLEAPSDSDDDEVMQTVSKEAITTKKSRLFSPIGSNEGDALSSTDFSEVMTKNMQVKVQLEAASDSHDDEVIQTVSGEAIITTQSHLFSPIGSNEGNALSSTDFSEVITRNMQVKVQLEAESDSDDDEVMQTVSEEAIITTQSYLYSPIDSNEGVSGNSNFPCQKSPTNLTVGEAHFDSQKETLTLVKLQINAASDIDEDEDTYEHNVNRISSTSELYSIFSTSQNLVKNVRNSSSLPCDDKSLKSPSNLCKNIPDPEIYISGNTQLEKEYLQSDNSRNDRNNTENDKEIQMILDKMRLHQMISPIPATPLPGTPLPAIPVPATPLPRKNQSPEYLQLKAFLVKEVKQMRDNLEAEIKSLRLKFYEKYGEECPESLEEIPQHSDDEQNEDNLNISVIDTNTGNKEIEHDYLPIQSNILSNNRQPDLADVNSGSVLVITEVREDEDDSFEECASLEQNLEIENVTHVISGINNIKKNEKTSDKNLSCMVKKSKIIKAPVVKIETSKLTSSENTNNEPFDQNSVHITHETTQRVLDNDTEHEGELQASGDYPNISNVITSKNNIVYEDTLDSDPEYIDLENSVHNLNPIPGLNTLKGKAKKLTKLEKLRVRMVPKSKIKRDLRKSVKKPCFKPKPISLPAPKKKVTESDTAASLNDKSVYENAVKVLAELKSAEPRIVLKDCVLYSKAQKKSEETVEKNTSINKKRKLLENSTKALENYNIDLNLSLDCKDSKKNKRTSPRFEEHPKKASIEIKQKLNDDNRKFNEDLHEKSFDKQKPNNSRNESNIKFENCNSKRTHDAVFTNLVYTNETKRKRTVTDNEMLIKKSDCNSNIVKSSNCRILRSSSQSIVESHKKSVQSQPEQIYYSPIARKHRISRLNNHTQPDSESKHNLSYNNNISNITQNNDGRTRVNTQIKQESDRLLILPNNQTTPESTLNNNRRPSRVNTNSKRDSESKQILSSYESTPESPQKNNGRPSRVNTNSQRDSESKQILSSYDTTPESPQKSNGRRSRVNTNSQRDSESKQILTSYDTTPESPQESNGRRSRVTSNSQRDSEIKQILLSYDNTPESPQKNNGRPSRVNSNSKRDSESKQMLSRYDSTPESPEKNNGRPSRVNMNSQRDSKNTQILPNNKNSQESSQNNNSRPFRVNTFSQRDSESTQNLSNKNITSETTHKNNDRIVSSYADIELLLNTRTPKPTLDKPSRNGRKDSLLCQMIEKYGVRKLKLATKAPPENKIQEITKKLENSLSEIVELPHEECVSGMKKLVAEIRTWDVKNFLVSFVKFLRNPERKIELYSKSICPPAPPMSKKEQVLLYVIDEVQKSSNYRNIVEKILTHIEYALFALNKQAEEFDVIEAMSHFYAILCRSYKKISKLRLFIVDAMYCLQLKSVILVQQCLDVWMNALPMGHLGLAKCPLVTCLVYLLHFYKCEDKFGRVKNIRFKLRKTYNYNVVDWTETHILDQFRTSVTEIRDSPMERKILRLSLLILAKRNGASWCHNNIVKNMLQPLINDENTPDSAKRFCISLLGPLLKPYPSNMKVHCETINNYLMDMLDKSNSLKMQEAIVSSLICLDKNNNRLHQFLASWTPAQLSPEFWLIFKNYVRSKPVHVWKKLLSWHIVRQ